MAGDAGGARRPARRAGRDPGSPARCTASSLSTRAAASCAPRSSGTTAARARSVARSRSGSASDRLVALTGNVRSPASAAPKLLYQLAVTDPATYGRIAGILLPKDYVRLRLTGDVAIDAADASRTLLFDVGARRWSEEVLGALELPGEWLPPVLRVARRPGGSGRGRPGGRRARCRRRPAGAALGGARNLGCRFRRVARLRRGS